jgi:capsular exopolysaccharide synthesis family protein
MATEYMAWSTEAKAQMVGEASKDLAAQAAELRTEIVEKEHQLAAYGKEKDIVSVDPGSNVTLQKLESLNRDYAGAVADRVTKEARYHEMRTVRPDTVADTLSGGLISSMRGDQLRLEREYAEKLNLFKPEWPAMQQLKAQIDKGRENLDLIIQETVTKAREAARSEYQTALRREQSLVSVLGAQKSEAQTLSGDAIEYISLQAEVRSKREVLDSLTKRLAETHALSGVTSENVSAIQLVDRALPPGSPFRPSYTRNGMLGLAAGLALGVGLAFLLSLLDRSLRTPEQVEQYLQLPALGFITRVGPNGGYRRAYAKGLFRRKKAEASVEEESSSIELLPHRQPRSRVAENYRAFRTALLLSRAGGVKSLVITSTFSREGKTATAVNLAVVLGQLGKRVLLVDADLHRPRIHEVLHISNRVGLVSILAENLEPARAIVKTDLPEVYAVPSGPSSPNPSGLLSSEAMTTFLELARTNFDYVVLDAPPVAPVADPIVLGHQTDGVVLCVKGGETPREQVVRVRDKLLRSNVRILGVVLNALAEEPGLYGARYDDGYYAEAGTYGEKPAAATGRT